MKGATASNRKISWLAREESAGTLNLQPQFQRRPVWRPDQSSYLIDTVLSGLPFPEIYVRTQTSESGETRYEIVDGQQRVRALLGFARNEYELSGSDVAAPLRGKCFKDLSKEEKARFWNYDVITRELHEASDSDIRDLFRRLNISQVTLNDQELRHAKYTGEFIEAMTELADDPWWLEHGVVSIRNVRRMEDVEYVSELMIALMAGPQDKKKSIDDFYDDYENEFQDRDKWMQRFAATRDLTWRILDREGLRVWNGKSDFYSLFHVVGLLVERRARLAAVQRKAIRAVLIRFQAAVGQAKRKDNTRTFPRAVQRYADAVTRAATDIARRRLRLQILNRLIDDAIDA